MPDWKNDEGLRQRLRDLWAEDSPQLSTAEMGRRLQVTKNAVVGAAHRMGLPPRPSPIRHGRKEKVPVKRETKVPTGQRKTLPSMEAPVPLPAAYAQARAVILDERRKAAASTTPASPAYRHEPLVNCCWPIGIPGSETFRFCGDTSVPGKPYCNDHALRAYVKFRPKSEGFQLGSPIRWARIGGK